MTPGQCIAGLAACWSALAAGGAALAQSDYPARPIRIVTAAAGGGSDFTARLVAQGLTSSLGQQVIVDNRGGAGGVIAGQIVTKAPPDGHTLLIFTSPLWLAPLVQDSVPYDPVRDFAPISLTDSSPSVLVVHPSLPVTGVRELIALGRSRPGELNYSRASAGGPSHLAAELFKSMAGIRMTEVPYKGGGPAVVALLGGEVELSFASAGAAATHIRSKRLRALAVTTAQPSPLFHDLPTIAAAGLPGFHVALVNGMFAPAGTPAAVIGRVNQAVVRTLRQPEVVQRYLATGIEVVGSSPEELAATVAGDVEKWGRLLRSTKQRNR